MNRKRKDAFQASDAVEASKKKTPRDVIADGVRWTEAMRMGTAIPPIAACARCVVCLLITSGFTKAASVRPTSTCWLRICCLCIRQADAYAFYSPGYGGFRQEKSVFVVLLFKMEFIRSFNYSPLSL